MALAVGLLPTFIRGIGWYIIAIYALMIPGFAYLLVWSHFWGRRGFVRVNDNGIIIHDWQNEEVFISWEEFKELHQLSGLWQIHAHAPSLRIVVQTDLSLRLGPRLIDLALLREEIIERGNLTEKQNKSWGTRYFRLAEEE
jgi:hypothetical protein